MKDDAADWFMLIVAMFIALVVIASDKQDKDLPTTNKTPTTISSEKGRNEQENGRPQQSNGDGNHHQG